MSDQTDVDDNLIPIETIDGVDPVDDGPYMPQALIDDPFTGDGSAGRDGVGISPWRLHTLGRDRLMSISEPEGHDRKSRKARKARQASQRVRSESVRKSRKRLSVVTGFIIAAIIAGAAGAAISYVYELWGGKTIPYVVGVSQTNATEQLENKGLKVTIETVPSDTVDGRVVGIEPAEGERVDEGSEVKLIVGVGRTIPEVVGMSREEARSTLEAAGAENIRFQTQVAAQEEDKVLSVSPGAGSIFMSSDEITVVVSQRPRMLDVVGQEQEMALLHLEREGIAARTEIEKSDADKRMHVVHTVPEAGQTVGDEGAVIYVGDPLINPLRVEDYFDATAPHIQEFLLSEGYAGKVGYRTKDGHVKVRFENDAQVSIAFVAEPWKHAIDSEQSGYANLLDESPALEGVRLRIPLSRTQTKTVQKQDESGKMVDTTVEEVVPVENTFGLTNLSVGESTAQDVMALCGLDGMLESCTQSNIVLPKGTTNNGAQFYCCHGESAKHTWTIMIKSGYTNGTLAVSEIVVTAAPKATYASIDLTKHGNKVCDYVAYQELYV